MGKDVSITIVLQENLSDIEKTVKKSASSINNSLASIRSEIQKLNKITIKPIVDLTELKKYQNEINNINKTKISFGSMSSMRVSITQLEAIQDKISRIKETKLTFETATALVATTETPAATSAGVENNSKKPLSANQKSLINAGVNFAGSVANSALGSTGGTLVGSALSGAASNFLNGGGVVGAGVGLIVGLIDGAVKNFEKKDEAFKDYYKNQYTTITQAQEASLKSSIDLATKNNPDSEYNKANKTVTTMRDSVEADKGEAYTKTRTEGLKLEEARLYGYTGDTIRASNKAIGEYEALLDNSKSEYKYQAIKALGTGTFDEGSLYENSESKGKIKKLSDEYNQMLSVFNNEGSSKEDKIKAGAVIKRIMAEIEGISINEYNNSTGAQAEKESEKALAENLKNNAAKNEEFWNAGLELGDQFSKGLCSSIEGLASIFPEKVRTAVYEASKNEYGVYPYAYGLSYVPYNNFPALLHEGERVLTASEARNYGSAPNVNISGNSFAVREEADIEKIARQIVSQFAQAYELAV